MNIDRASSAWPKQERLREIFSSISQSGGCVVGAFMKGSMVGTCTVNMCSNLSWSGRSYAVIENVIVSKFYRKQGIGKAVLLFAKGYAQQSGCYKVALMTGSITPDTHKFYQSLGFAANKQGYTIRFDV